METRDPLASLVSREEREILAFHLEGHQMEERETMGEWAHLVCLEKVVERDIKATLDLQDTQENQGNVARMEAQVPKVILAGRGYQDQ